MRVPRTPATADRKLTIYHSQAIAFVWVDNIGPTVRIGELRTIVFTGPDDVVLEIWDRATYGPVFLDLQRVGH